MIDATDTTVAIGVLAGLALAGWFAALVWRWQRNVDRADVRALVARLGEVGEESARTKAELAAAHVREKIHADSQPVPDAALSLARAANSELRRRLATAEETEARLRSMLDDRPVQIALPAGHTRYDRYPVCECGAHRRKHANGSHGAARTVGGCAETKCVAYRPSGKGRA